jgi:hypothetical protein
LDRLSPLEALERRNPEVYGEYFVKVIEEVKSRFSTNPVDKVAGIAILLRCQTLPVYRSGISEETAWNLFVGHMGPDLLSVLLFCFPMPGDQGFSWRPSWTQLMGQDITLPTMMDLRRGTFVDNVDGHGFAHYIGQAFTGELVWQEKNDRGEGEEQSIKILAKGSHNQVKLKASIQRSMVPASGTYTFVGDSDMEMWVICEREIHGRLRKVSIAIMGWSSSERLENEDICTEQECVFI